LLICNYRESYEMHAQAIIRYFIYNIRNKIVKRREEKATVELLWTHNSVFASKLDNCGEEKNILKIVLSFTNKHKFYSNWKLSKLRKSAIEKFRIALYNVFILSSLANQKWDILLSIL